MTRIGLITMLSALPLLAAGCGAGGGGHSTAASSASPNLADQQVKFATCMRQHGVNLPDPSRAGGVRITAAPGEMDKVNAAMQACRSLAPAGKLGAQNDPAARDRMLKLAQCFRQHGLNVPDPQPGQGLMIQGSGKAPQNVEQIDQACRKELGIPNEAKP